MTDTRDFAAGLDRSPLAPGRSVNFTNFELSREGNLWCYRPTRQAEWFVRIVLSAGIALLVIGLLMLLAHPLYASLTTIAGGIVYYAGHLARRAYNLGASFDPDSGLLEVPAQPLMKLSKASFNPRSEIVHLDNAAAFQVLKKWARVNDASMKPFEAWELNLVLTSGKRFNLVDNNNREALADEVHLLSESLQLPVYWQEAEEA